MLVALDHHVTLLALDRHRDDFLGVITGFLGRGGALLAAQAEGVLVGAADAIVGGDVVAGDRHAVDAIGLFHCRIDEAPAEGGVFQLLAAPEGAVGLAHDIGRTGHGLHPGGDHQVHLAQGDGAVGLAHRFHARGAEAIEGHARHRFRQSRQQHRHACHVAIVFPGLVGAAHEHLVHGRPVHLGIALLQRLERNGRQVVGTHGGQSAVEPADGGADGVADIDGATHSSPPFWPPWAAVVRACRSRRASSSVAVGASVVAT